MWQFGCAARDSFIGVSIASAVPFLHCNINEIAKLTSGSCYSSSSNRVTRLQHPPAVAAAAGVAAAVAGGAEKKSISHFSTS